MGGYRLAVAFAIGFAGLALVGRAPAQTAGEASPGSDAGLGPAEEARVRFSDLTRWQTCTATLERLARAVVEEDPQGFDACFSKEMDQPRTILVNGFRDDLQKRTRMSLDLTINRQSSERNSTQADLFWRLTAVDKLTGESLIPREGNAKLVFARSDGYRIRSFQGAPFFGFDDPATLQQVGGGQVTPSGTLRTLTSTIMVVGGPTGDFVTFDFDQGTTGYHPLGGAWTRLPGEDLAIQTQNPGQVNGLLAFEAGVGFLDPCFVSGVEQVRRVGTPTTLNGSVPHTAGSRQVLVVRTDQGQAVALEALVNVVGPSASTITVHYFIAPGDLVNPAGSATCP